MSVALHEIKTEFENYHFSSFTKLFDVIKMLTQKQTCRDRGRFFWQTGSRRVVCDPCPFGLCSSVIFCFLF